MFKSKSIISLALALSLSATTAIPSFAMTTDEIIAGWSGVVNLSVDPLNSSYLKISGTEGADVNDAETKLRTIARSLGVINGADFKGGLWSLGEDSYATMNYDDAETGLNKFNFCVDWLKNNMPIICPNGTNMNEVASRCAQWLGDNVNYDYTAYAAKDTWKYQSAYTAFDGTGLGICATYSAAFVSMVAFVPIETGTSYVNWDTENCWYFETGQYYGGGHQWSVVKDPVTHEMHQYDVTWYDGVDRPHTEYLDMSPETLAKWHANVGAEFFPNVSLRPASLSK